MLFPFKMAGIRNKKLDREDYEFVGGETNTFDREMVWFRIDGRCWRVQQLHDVTVYNGATFQEMVSNYQIVDSVGNERYIAVEEFFGFCRGLGSVEGVTVISGLEESLEESREAHMEWQAERTRKS